MIICENCHQIMTINDIDYNFPGNKDIYYTCDFCQTSAIEKIRFFKSFSVEYYREERK